MINQPQNPVVMPDNRNIIDYYKYWETDAIKANLDTKRLNYSIICLNIAGDFNIGSIIRNSNAFLAKEVIIFGKKQWDKRGAVGTYKYQHILYLYNKQDLIQKIGQQKIVAVDNVKQAKNITDFVWPKEHFYLVFGEEQRGIDDWLLMMADDIIYIPQLGSVRSLNVGCASAIAMYDYTNKLNKL